MKVEPTRSANELDVGYNRKRRVQAGCGDFGLSNHKDAGVALDVEVGSLMEGLG